MLHKKNSTAYEVPLIPVRYARQFLDFVGAQGIARDAVLYGAELDIRELDNPDMMLNMRQTIQILDQARRLLDDERAGFRFGQKLDLLGHGLLGFSLLWQQDQRDLIRMHVQYIRVALPIMDMDIQCVGGEIRVRLHDVWDLGGLRPFIVAVYMGSVHSLASLVCRHLRFEFDFHAQRPANEWESMVEGSSMVFGAPVSQVLMPLSGRPPWSNDASLSYYLAGARSRESLQANGDMEVVALVRQKLLDNPGRDSTLERVAERLEMSPRSVRHHLRRAGASFHGMRNEIREAFATRYLTETYLSLQRIAEVLGYSDQASFTKAYRVWTGTTPGEVRRRKKKNDA
ncbi:AraC family transcriptional regulator [Alcanivorax sp. JB21]|uniref:helix-turn-helix domain-containing protein n=1 Tax=Alcanivorax limicola TaxID=2874102 RepID=UPI001CBAEE35|nr:AraC family transcriptional regulator [Alcanivorax limicola]MBZ2187492.1 AraC family transcriptional regulator [Alcanivorax limicola]